MPLLWPRRSLPTSDQLGGAVTASARDRRAAKTRGTAVGLRGGDVQWLDLAEPSDHGALDEALRLQAIQTEIGSRLRAHYQLPCDLPHQLLTLLMQLNGKPEEEHRHL